MGMSDTIRLAGFPDDPAYLCNVKRVDPSEFPKRRHGYTGYVLHGYVVELGTLGTFFYTALEPALAFGRAARQSFGSVTTYSVEQAALRVRWNERLRRDVRTLYIGGDQLDRRPEEQDSDAERVQLRRWADHVNPHYSSWVGCWGRSCPGCTGEPWPEYAAGREFPRHVA